MHFNDFGFHSLRHSFASFCAEAGVQKAVLLQALEERLDANSKPFPCDQLAPVLLPGGSVK
ncbi:MAG: hypothetical protein IJW17_13230 [Lentisphaeria bacterium]|nr:hypothetical protein [Lentisphaeria bacterium]